ncbi:MAG: Holliday junction branch migration protein RuvA [Alphaproteobacteria bacterium]|nr:MAG: Holliday junction branch migration protein RuvA [Alphaproteobacteria bacterium]
MIGKLTGRLDSAQGGTALIDVGGVGYVVACPARVVAELGGAGADVSLLIETQVREDAISLYGFADSTEREVFRLLQTVQGVGARVALALLSAHPPARLATAVATEDKAALSMAEGVGPKLAARLVTELRERLPGLVSVAPISTAARVGLAGTEPSAAQGVLADAVSALVGLGYRRPEAFAAASAIYVSLGEGAALDDVLRASLKRLAA